MWGEIVLSRETALSDQARTQKASGSGDVAGHLIYSNGQNATVSEEQNADLNV
jgi:hypothetical protein